MGTLVACDDVETAPPTAQVTAVNVVPAQLQLTVGGTGTLTATVVGDAGLQDRSVTWTSSNPAVATVDAAGNVKGVAAGQTTIIAASHADPNVKGAAAVVVNAAAVPAVSISSITKNGQPIDINNVQGQIDVTLNLSPNGAPINSVDLLVQCPNNASPVLVQSQSFSGAAAPSGPITLSFNSAAINAAGTGPTFTNGACNIIARLTTPSGSPAAQDVVRPATFQNVDYVAATITGKTGVDASGNTWVGGGDIQVKVTPVLFSGQTAASGIVTLTGTDNATGATISRQVTWTGAGTQTVTFPNVSTGTNAAGVAGLTLPDAKVTATVLTSSGAAVPTITQAAAFRLDEQAPAAGSYVFNTQGTANNWVGANYTFVSGLETASMSTLGFNMAGNGDWGGVDRVTVLLEAAPFDPATQTCTVGAFNSTNASSSLVFASVTNLAETLTNNRYCLRVTETDALGNVTRRIAGTFGVDKNAPTVLDVSPEDKATDVTNADPIVITVRDTLSGIGPTPVNGTITRLSSTGSQTCVLDGDPATSGCQEATVGTVTPSATVAGAADITIASATNGSTTQGYYTFNGTVRDQAANRTATITRQYLFDTTAPASVTVGEPASITGQASAVFPATATDNVDLVSARSTVSYTSGISIRAPETVTLGTAFDNVLTTSASFSINPSNWYNTLSSSVNVAGATPSAVAVTASDAAGNSTTGTRTLSTLALPASVSGFTFNTVGVQAFDMSASNSATVCNPTTGNPCSTNPESVTLSAVVTGPTSTFQPPFTRVDFYYQVGTELRFIGSSTSGSTLDNGTNRTYTYTQSFNPPSSFASGSTVTVWAIGVNAAGNALATTTTVNVTNP